MLVIIYQYTFHYSLQMILLQQQ